jgi:hypothetical protein
MIFLTLFAVGAIAAWLTGWLRGVRGRQDAAFGTAGAFLLGGLAVGLAERPLGALDPLVLALGALGGVGAALLAGVIDRDTNDAAADDKRKRRKGRRPAPR